MTFNMEQFEAHVATLIEKHQLAAKELDERQLAQAIRQALLCGDFQKYIHPNGGTLIVYIPFAYAEQLHSEIARLKTMLEQHGINSKEGT